MTQIAQSCPPSDSLKLACTLLNAIVETSKELKQTMASPPDAELDEWQSAPALIERIEQLSKGALNNLSPYVIRLRTGGDVHVA